MGFGIHVSFQLVTSFEFLFAPNSTEHTNICKCATPRKYEKQNKEITQDKTQGLFKDFQEPKTVVFKYQKYR